MDFQLNDDQQALVSALQSILQDHTNIPQDSKLDFFWHDADLQEQLEANGFLDAARDMGPLEAALVVHETAKLVSTTDTLGRGLVAPLSCPEHEFSGAVALVEKAHIGRAIRNLPIAKHILIADGRDVLVLDTKALAVKPVESILAFPYGCLETTPDLSSAVRITGAGETMKKWWRVGLAAEITGAAMGAIEFTTEYVTQREVFGRPVGSFQSVQHRMVKRYGYARSGYFLAMRAAWSGTETDAAIAAAHAQSGLRDLLFDLHQFNGGMGMTTEHLIHFWLYRARALQAEAGGQSAASLEISDRRWGAEDNALSEPLLSKVIA